MRTIKPPIVLPIYCSLCGEIYGYLNSRSPDSVQLATVWLILLKAAAHVHKQNHRWNAAEDQKAADRCEATGKEKSP